MGDRLKENLVALAFIYFACWFVHFSKIFILLLTDHIHPLME